MGTLTRKAQPVLSQRIITIIAVIVAMFAATFMMTANAFAEDASSAKTEAAETALKQTVVSTLGANQYALEGGGYISGADLFEGKNSQVTVNQNTYSSLSSKAQNQFATDLITEIQTASTDPNLEDKGVTQETGQNWLKNLQSTKGLGTKLMSSILSDGTSADFVGAQTVFAPFAGPIGLAIGIITVVTMSLLVLSFAIDLAYIVLPFFREKTQGGGGSDKGGNIMGRLVSTPARKSVEVAENAEGAGSEPVWIYLKKRIWGIFILSIAILLLVSGEAFNVVGKIMDMMIGLVSMIVG